MTCLHYFFTNTHIHTLSVSLSLFLCTQGLALSSAARARIVWSLLQSFYRITSESAANDDQISTGNSSESTSSALVKSPPRLTQAAACFTAQFSDLVQPVSADDEAAAQRQMPLSQLISRPDLSPLVSGRGRKATKLRVKPDIVLASSPLLAMLESALASPYLTVDDDEFVKALVRLYEAAAAAVMEDVNGPRTLSPQQLHSFAESFAQVAVLAQGLTNHSAFMVVWVWV